MLKTVLCLIKSAILSIHYSVKNYDKHLYKTYEEQIKFTQVSHF